MAIIALKQEVKKKIKGENVTVASRGTLWDSETGKEIKLGPFIDPGQPSLSTNKGFQEIQKQKLGLVTNILINSINHKYPNLEIYKGKVKMETVRDNLAGTIHKFSRELKINEDKSTQSLLRKLLPDKLTAKTTGSITVGDSNFWGHVIDFKGNKPLYYFGREIVKKPIEGWNFYVHKPNNITWLKAADGYLHWFYRLYPKVTESQRKGREKINEDFKPVFLIGKDCAFQTPINQGSYNMVLHAPNKSDEIIIAGVNKTIDDLVSSFSKKDINGSFEVASIEKSHEWYPPHTEKKQGENGGDKAYGKKEFTPVDPSNCAHVYFHWLKPVPETDIQEFKEKAF